MDCTFGLDVLSSTLFAPFDSAADSAELLADSPSILGVTFCVSGCFDLDFGRPSRKTDVGNDTDDSVDVEFVDSSGENCSVSAELMQSALT